MRTALASLVACGVGIAVAVVLADTYSWWESALVGVFCAVPLFLLGAVWAGSADARQSAS